MTKKAEFNADEWSTIVEGPLLAAMRVVAASRGGTIRESVAISKAYNHAREQQGENELLDDLARTPPAVERGRVGSPGDIGRVSAEQLREALGLLEQKATPEEVEAYKRFVLTVAEAAANAHKEGGFMGVGGKRISDSERAALDEIEATLQPAAQ